MAVLLYFIDAGIPMYAVGRAYAFKQPGIDILEVCRWRTCRRHYCYKAYCIATPHWENECVIEVTHLFVSVVPTVSPVTVTNPLKRKGTHGAVPDEHLSLTFVLYARGHRLTMGPPISKANPGARARANRG